VIRAAAVLACVIGGLVLIAPGSTHSGLSRTTTDQPDDIIGPQVHVVYAIPADGTDRGLDTNGTIAASVGNWENWLRGQTGGHALRLDTAHGAVDVTFFRLPDTQAQVMAQGTFARDLIEKDLKAAGLTAPNKIYAVYYDGQSTAACGGGAWPPLLKGIVGAIYLPSTYWNTAGDPCYVPQASLSGMNLMDFAILHELMHTIGIVPLCSPHQTRAGHVSDSPTDLMYAGNEDWHPSVLDIGHDDYFDAHIPGCLDLTDSPYYDANDSYKFTVAVAGHGTVTSTPAGIACGATCSASFGTGSTVTLSAAAATGSLFTGWGGDCSGTSACRVSLTAAASVTASFSAKPKVLPRCKKGQKSSKKHRCRT
jgi:hypothetical protein